MMRGKAGVNSETLAGAALLTDGSTFVQRLNPNGADRTVKVVPQARGRAFIIVNTGTGVGYTLDITDRDDTAVVSIDAGESYIIYGTGTGLVAIPMNESNLDALALGDNDLLTLGDAGSADFSATHNGTDTIFDSAHATAKLRMRLGTTTSATQWQVESDGGATQFLVQKGDGAFSTSLSTADLDASGAIQVNSSAGAISIGNDAVAQAVNIGTGAAARVITVGNAASASLTLEAGVGALTANSDAGMTFTDTGATGQIKFTLGSTDANTGFTVEQLGGNDLITVTGDGQHGHFIKDNSATAYVIAQAGNSYLGIDTTDAGPAMTYGNVTTFPTHTFAGFMACDDAVASGPSRRIGGRVDVDTAAGTSHTNSTDEAVLTSYSIPANTIKTGTTVRVRWGARVTADNSTTTLTGRLRLGATTLTGTVLAVTAAVDTASGDWFTGEFILTGRAAPGASAAIVGVGSTMVGAIGASGAAPVQQALPATNFATNAALLLEVTADWSAADANAVQSEFWHVEIIG